MRTIGWLLLGSAFGALAVSAFAAAPEAPLRGTLTLRGATLVDPPPDEAMDTHAAFFVEGAAARLLYDALQGPPADDACDGGGGSIKRSGNVACSRSADGATYECHFAIDLERGRVTLGAAC